MRAQRRVRGRVPILAVYPLLALLAFPTIQTLAAGTRGWTYALDVLDDGGGLPRLAIAVREWSAHGLSLWDPYLTAGNAFLGQFALAPVGIDVALAFVVGPFAAFAIMVWLTSSVAGIGMHLFLRDGLRLSMPAVLAGSIIAVFGFWHSIYGISVAVLPLVLWLGDRADPPDDQRRGRPRPGWPATVGSVLLGALALYAGHVQIGVFLAAIQLGWIVATTDRARLPRRVLRWALTWALSFALFAPVLVTQLVLLPLSERTVWDLQYLFGASPGEALATILRHYEGILIGLPTGSLGPSVPRYGTLFLGGIGLPLAVLGIVAGPRTRGARFIVLLLVAIPALDLAAMIGAAAQEQLGILRSFQFVRIRHFFPFALAAAAALGVDVLAGRRAPDSSWPRLGARARVLPIGLMTLAVVPVAIQLALTARRALAAVRSFQASDPLDLAWILGVAGVAIGVAGGIALIALVATGRAHPLARGALIGLGVLLIGERLLLSTAVPLFGQNISTFDERLALTPAQAFLLRQPGIAGQRVLTFGDHANRMAFQGLRQADGYQAIYPLAYHGFFGRMTAPGLALDPARSQYFHSWGGRAYAFRPEVDPELVSLVGVRWLYVRAAPGTDVPTVPGLIPRFQDPEVSVYENPAALGRAFLVGAVDPQRDDATALAALGDATLDELTGSAIATTAELEHLGPPAAALSGAATGPSGTATIVEDAPDRVVVDVTPDRAGLLVLSDTMSPGWEASVDGRAVPIATVDGAFRGVAIGPEARRVVFAYRPQFTRLGAVGAGLALVVLGGWAFMERRRNQRTLDATPTLSHASARAAGRRGGDDV
jgi:Protein of unknown function (DUF6044)/Bacterial membrane protein YfhO